MLCSDISEEDEDSADDADESCTEPCCTSNCPSKSFFGDYWHFLVFNDVVVLLWIERFVTFVEQSSSLFFVFL